MLWSESDCFDSNIPMVVDSLSTHLENAIPEHFLYNLPVIQKRPNIRLIPRIGRRKRFVSEDSNNHISQSFTENSQDLTAVDIRNILQNGLAEKRAVFIPRVGRAYIPSTIGRSLPQLVYRSRGTFINVSDGVHYKSQD